MTTIQTLLIAGALATPSIFATFARADATMDHTKTGAVMMAQSDTAAMADAEVRKVDLAQGKLTLKHGEITNLDMPPMTMVFTVKDKAMLENVKPGDRIRFKATSEDGKLTVVELVPAN